jgi:succinate dehydrogenase / fumarate reductase cytochrome b subunit
MSIGGASVALCIPEAAPYNPAPLTRIERTGRNVTTATAPDLTLPAIGGPHHFLLRRLHSLTGIVFGLYVAFHLFINATIVQGGHVYQEQVDKIHGLPFLIAVEWATIYLPIIFHTVYGMWIIFTGQPNNGSYPYFKNGLYLLQRISAIILIAFIAFHIFSMKGLFGHAMAFDPRNANPTVIRGIDAHWFVAWIIYPIGILAACYHTANGFWTAAVSWGLTISAGGQRRWGWICTVVFCGMLIAGSIALAAVIAGSHVR